MVVGPLEQFLLEVLSNLNEAQASWYVARKAAPGASILQ